MIRRNWKTVIALSLTLSFLFSTVIYAGEDTGGTEDKGSVTVEERDAYTEQVSETAASEPEELPDTEGNEDTEGTQAAGETKEPEVQDSQETLTLEESPEPADVPAVHYGWYQSGNDWYYYNQSGVMATGWRKINNVWYYLDGDNSEKPGVMAADCKMAINGRTYFFRGDGAMLTGWVRRPEGWYYTDGSGAMLTGWRKIKNVWYYLDGNDTEYPGLMAANCGMEIGGHTYFFHTSGAMASGWVRRPEGWYYTDGSGAMLTGWRKIKNVWYYLDGNDTEYPGLMAADCGMEIGKYTYFFRTSGAMQTGWVLRPEGWYYTDGSGAMLTGWRRVNGKWYYLDPANEEHPGLMVANCKMQIGEHEYYFNSQGAMREGWYKEGEDWYYYDPSGLIASGWRKVNGTWYYLDPENENKMACGGWKQIGGAWYYLKSSGAMATNWLKLGNDWYYVGSDGAMKTGWILLGENWYYLYTKDDPHGGSYGVMAKDTVIDGYVIAPNGAYNQAYQQAYNILNQVGWNLRAAYNWSLGLTYYKMIDTPDPGSAWFANYGYQNRKGNCYVMAATFYHMAVLLGYDAHQVSGYVLNSRGGMSPHSWVEIAIDGTIYIFDISFANGAAGRNGYQFTYGTSGTWRYTNYYRMN